MVAAERAHGFQHSLDWIGRIFVLILILWILTRGFDTKLVDVLTLAADPLWSSILYK